MGERLGNTMTNIVKYKLQKGISLVEALVSTTIVAIGFLAVFQLVNYSVNSIDVSAERTKINYITSMIAEDMIGSRDQTHGDNPASKDCIINDYGKPVTKDGEECTLLKYADYIEKNPIEFPSCSDKGGPIFNKVTSIYEKEEVTKSAPENKINRWKVILGEDRYLKCRSDPSKVTDGDTKSIKVFKICATGTGCMSGSSDTIFDELYIGRVEINTNGGNKRRSLYFQADYIFKE